MITKGAKKAKEVDDAPETLADVLAKIKKTSKLGDVIRKDLGQVKLAAESPEDMYLYEYKKPDLEHKAWKILHGKCLDAGTSELLSWGYIFVQIKHFPLSDASLARTRCVHCKEQLDEVEAERQIIARDTRLKDEHEAYLEWEQEQILLGKR